MVRFRDGSLRVRSGTGEQAGVSTIRYRYLTTMTFSYPDAEQRNAAR